MKAFTWIGWAAGVALCAYVAFNGLQYLTPGFSAPDFIARNAMARPWLCAHAGVASLALVLGPFQFLPVVRRRLPGLHRWLGRTYVLACLAAGLTGLVLATGTTAGTLAAAGFAALAALTLATAFQGWRLAAARRFEEHREWMIRSYALILAGVMLRLWLPASMMARLDFMTSYQAIAFLSWVPNLLVAELYLAATRRPALPRRLA